MDWMFIVCAVIGLAVWVASYVSERMSIVRDNLGKGETGNRMLLLLIPGITVICLGVVVAQAALLGTGANFVRVSSTLFALILIVGGLALALSSFIPFTVPRFLRPAWLRAQDEESRLGALKRFQARQSGVKSRPQSLELVPVSNAGVALALPRSWDINLNLEAKKPGVFPVFQAKSGGEEKQVFSLNRIGPLTSEKMTAVMEKFTHPNAWQVEEILAGRAGAYPALNIRLSKPGLTQQRWIISQGSYCWVFTAINSENTQTSDKENQLVYKVLATLTLPGTHSQQDS